MKKLIFVRHGKAEDPSPEFSDYERSLTVKGKTISKEMASRLLSKESDPGIFVSSPAFRALETAIIFAREFGTDPGKIILNSNIYFKMNLNILSNILSDIPEDINSVILFGHNPDFTEIVNLLAIEGADFMGKSNIVGIYFKTKVWSGISRNTGKIEYFLKH